MGLGSHTRFLAKGRRSFYKMADARRMIYPYSFFGKFARTPWSWMYKNGRGFRYIVISTVVISPLWFKISAALTSDANKAQWAKIRAGYYHDHFAAPEP